MKFSNDLQFTLLSILGAVAVFAAMPVARSVARALLPPWPQTAREKRQADGDLMTMLVLFAVVAVALLALKVVGL